MESIDERSLTGSCGLYCGLCPRYQSNAPSRCQGCQLGTTRSYCSVYRCCVTKHKFLTCAECPQYPCGKLLRTLRTDRKEDSFLTHKQALPNLDEIRRDGLSSFLDEQRKRRLLAEYLIANYNAGRSVTLYCTACALLPSRTVERTISRMERSLDELSKHTKERKELAKEMRKLLKAAASDVHIDLALRRKTTRP